jgi:hypothetical protein
MRTEGAESAASASKQCDQRWSVASSRVLLEFTRTSASVIREATKWSSRVHRRGEGGKESDQSERALLYL